MSVRAMKWAASIFEAVDLKPCNRMVLLALCWHHTDKDGCFPSQEVISEYSGYRVRRVRDILKEIEDAGLIKRKQVRRGGKHTNTVYVLFGTYHRQTGAGRKGSHHRHYPADGDHRQTGAGYRGIYSKEDPSQKVVVQFPEKSLGAA